MTLWLIIFAALIVGLLLVLGGRGMRDRRGLGHGRTTELDNRTLYSARYGLAGRPDRIIEGNIPEEWKGSKRVYDSHRAQLGCYFILHRGGNRRPAAARVRPVNHVFQAGRAAG